MEGREKSIAKSKRYVGLEFKAWKREGSIFKLHVYHSGSFLLNKPEVTDVQQEGKWGKLRPQRIELYKENYPTDLISSV